MKKLYIFILFSLLSVGVCFGKTIKSETDNESDLEQQGFTQLASFNVDIMQFGLFHPGWGFGGDYEKYLGNHMAVTGLIQHNAFFDKWFQLEDFTSTLSVGANFRVYPFKDCLKGIYVGTGAGCDTMFHFGDSPVPDNIQKYYPYVKPEIGWKWYMFKHFMIDTHCYYKYQYVQDPDSLPKYYTKYMDNGFNIGISFKFFKGK